MGEGHGLGGITGRVCIGKGVTLEGRVARGWILEIWLEAAAGLVKGSGKGLEWGQVGVVG